ncbi:hypothetical protein BGZ60DRAFT_518892 [Tricladium varicosporioides]|nr:hypothetical protein BGZ60DRAFT_518892 [Hymenoscyphus varicosporioides]
MQFTNILAASGLSMLTMASAVMIEGPGLAEAGAPISERDLVDSWLGKRAICPTSSFSCGTGCCPSTKGCCLGLTCLPLGAGYACCKDGSFCANGNMCVIWAGVMSCCTDLTCKYTLVPSAGDIIIPDTATVTATVKATTTASAQSGSGSAKSSATSAVTVPTQSASSVTAVATATVIKNGGAEGTRCCEDLLWTKRGWSRIYDVAGTPLMIRIYEIFSIP